MPTFRLEDTEGRWLTNMQLNAPAWKPGDAIPRGRDTGIVEVRHGGEPVTLVAETTRASCIEGRLANESR
jgi:hypothetical protein